MTRAVLDASAVIALLLGEPGADKVEFVVADAAINTLNFGEVVSVFVRRGFTSSDMHSLLDPLPFERVLLDEELAYAAGLLAPQTRSAGLSLGDRACLALAMRLGVPAMTADRAWVSIAGQVGVEVQLIR